jgi:D-lactate dehydrogenase (cytochrome)
MKADGVSLSLVFPPDPGAAAALGGMCGTSCSGTLAWRYGGLDQKIFGS